MSEMNQFGLVCYFIGLGMGALLYHWWAKAIRNWREPKRELWGAGGSGGSQRGSSGGQVILEGDRERAREGGGM